MSDLSNIFKKAGGIKLISNYAQSGVLFYACIQVAILGLSKKSLEILRLGVYSKVQKKLRGAHKSTILRFIEANKHELERKNSKTVWFCWLQGIENAPFLVKKCYQSLNENLNGREIVVITSENYRDFVSFPQHIIRKLDQGVITKTHFSDLLRLELLISHGGTWVDATVFCSGRNIPEYMLDSELFLFQKLKPGLDGHSISISSWFMTSYTNHPILLLTRELLYKYWETNNRMADYFLLHHFFQIAIETYPEEWEKVIPFCNSMPHILLLNLFKEYDDKWFGYVKQVTPFHKLSYKFEQGLTGIEQTFYKHILS